MTAVAARACLASRNTSIIPRTNMWPAYFLFPPRVRKALASLACLLCVAGCATGPRGFPAAEGIINRGRVTDSLYRGGQPNLLGLESLKRTGVKTIVNLRMANDVWVSEEAEARSNGMIYTNVPMRGVGRPTARQVAQVLSIIETSAAPVFVHCEHGCDRTGTIIACYRIKHQQWTSQQALSEARQYGISKWEFGMKDFVVDFAKHHGRN